MIVTIILGLVSGLFAFLAQYKPTRWGLKVSFALICLFLGLRYNYGNDYSTYFNMFAEISQHDLFDASENPLKFEAGWIYLNELCRPLGFFGMTAVLAVFNCVIYYNFVKKYVPVKYYWIAIFIYVFTPEFMLINASAMRQSVAISLFILSIDFLYKKEPIRYFLCVGLASLFHLSALILFPIFLLGLFNWNLNKMVGVLLVVSFGLMILFNESLSIYLKEFIRIYFPKYEGYQLTGSINTGLGFVYGTGMLIVAVFYGRLQDDVIGLIFKIAIISFLLMPLNLVIDLLNRVGFYFLPATMVIYPIIVTKLKSPLLRGIFLTIIFAFAAWKYGVFFRNPDNIEYYSSYQTIFSASGWY